MLKVFVSTHAMVDPELNERLFASLSGTGWQRTGSTDTEADNPMKAFFHRGVAALDDVGFDAIREFCRKQHLAHGFDTLVQFCRAHALDLFCVGEGLDLCLQEILACKGLNGVRLFTNHLEQPIDGSGSFSVVFPYDDAECTRCACCARNLMLTLSGDHDRIVFIGCTDGDACAAEYADIIFAKGALQRHCQRMNVSYFLYDTLDDAVQRMERLLAAKRIKARREAAMKRRAAFLAE